MMSNQQYNKYANFQPEHVYYSNDVMNNNSTGDAPNMPLVFNEQRNANIIECAENYNLSVMRFSIDSPTLPIFIPQIQTGQTNVNQTVYSITMTYKTFTATAFIQYVPTDMTQPIPQSPLNGADYSSDYYSMYSYQKWILYVNTAFISCYTALNTACAAGSQSLPTPNVPFMEIDPINLTCILNSDILGFNSSLANPINIYFNTALYTLFTFFQYTRYGYTALNGKNYLLNVYFNNNTCMLTNSSGVVYTALQMFQEGSSSPLMNPIEAIVLTSNLPIVYEVIGLPNVYNSSTAPSGGGANTAPIICDFQIPFTALNNYRPNIDYQTTGEYRLLNLSGQSPINSIQISLYWRDKYQNLHQIMLGSNCGASIKLLFRRKSYLIEGI